MKLRISVCLEGKDVFAKTMHPDVEGFYRISYDFHEGRPMKWGATMEDAEPEEPDEVEIYKIEVQGDHNKLWADITSESSPELMGKLAIRILEGDIA